MSHYNDLEGSFLLRHTGGNDLPYKAKWKRFPLVNHHNHHTTITTTITQHEVSSPAVVGSTVPVAVLAVPVRVLAVHWVRGPWRL